MQKENSNVSSRKASVRDLPLALSFVKEEKQPCFTKQAEDPGQRPAGFQYTHKTSLSSPRVSIGDLLLIVFSKRRGFPITNFGNDPVLITTKQYSGFTLIELLVVVLIIGILAAVALPQYQFAVYKSKLARLIPLMKAVKQANQLFYLQNGYYTNDFTQWDIDLPPETTKTGDDLGLATLTIPGGIKLEPVSQAVEGRPNPRVQGTINNVPVTLHVYYERDQWMCYPRGTDIGWRLCKNYGCTGNIPAAGSGCSFSF